MHIDIHNTTPSRFLGAIQARRAVSSPKRKKMQLHLSAINLTQILPSRTPYHWYRHPDTPAALNTKMPLQIPALFAPKPASASAPPQPPITPVAQQYRRRPRRVSVAHAGEDEALASAHGRAPGETLRGGFGVEMAGGW